MPVFKELGRRFLILEGDGFFYLVGRFGLALGLKWVGDLVLFRGLKVLMWLVSYKNGIIGNPGMGTGTEVCGLEKVWRGLLDDFFVVRVAGIREAFFLYSLVGLIIYCLSSAMELKFEFEMDIDVDIDSNEMVISTRHLRVDCNSIYRYRLFIFSPIRYLFERVLLYLFCFLLVNGEDFGKSEK